MRATAQTSPVRCSVAIRSRTFSITFVETLKDPLQLIKKITVGFKYVMDVNLTPFEFE